MKVSDENKPVRIHLTYDEELECARKFCTMLDMLWLEDSPKIYNQVSKLFFKKSKGWDFLLEEFVELDDAIQHHNSTVDPKYAEYHMLPDLCDGLHEDGDCISMSFGVSPANVKAVDTTNTHKLRYHMEIARAWEEAWLESPKGYLRERFSIFPGEMLLHPGPTPNEKSEDDLRREREFWDMVDEKQEYFGCSRQQAIIEVTDYMPRAIFDENRMSDPNVGRIVKPVISMDEWEDNHQDD